MKRLAVLLAAILGLACAPSPAAQATTHDVRVLALMVNFSNDSSQPYSASLAQGVLFTNPDSLKQYWLDSTQGQVQISGEVHGWYTIADDNSGCDIGNWQTLARSAAIADGVNVDSFTHVVYGFSQGNCSWLGAAGGSLTGGTVYLNAGFQQTTVLHEFAHALGLGFHPDETDTVFYGPLWTLSGADQDWIGTDNPTVATTSGTYTFGTTDTGSLLRIPLPTAGQRLIVDWRAGKLYPLWSNYDLGGVSIKKIGPSDGTTIHTLSGGFCNSRYLVAGQELYDAVDRVLVHVDALTSTSATATVTLNVDAPVYGPDITAPSIPTGLQAKKGKAVDLWWISSTDDRDCSPSYRVFRNGTQIGVTDSANFTDTTFPKRTTVTYRVAAVDDAGNVSAQSASVTVRT